MCMNINIGDTNIYNCNCYSTSCDIAKPVVTEYIIDIWPECLLFTYKENMCLGDLVAKFLLDVDLIIIVNSICLIPRFMILI